MQDFRHVGDCATAHAAIATEFIGAKSTFPTAVGVAPGAPIVFTNPWFLAPPNPGVATPPTSGPTAVGLLIAGVAIDPMSVIQTPYASRNVVGLTFPPTGGPIVNAMPIAPFSAVSTPTPPGVEGAGKVVTALRAVI